MIDNKVFFYLGCLLPIGLILFFISIIFYPCSDYENDIVNFFIDAISIIMIIIGSIAIVIGWLSQ